MTGEGCSGPDVGSADSVYIRADYPSLGDELCLVGSARLYARRFPGTRVSVSALPDVVKAYRDGLVSHGRSGRVIVLDPARRHRQRDRSPCLNYLGTFAAELCMTFETPPALELPELDPPPGLSLKAYVALQPYSVYARNPERRKEFVQALIDAAITLRPEWPVVVVGRRDTPRDLHGLDYGHLGGPLALLRTVEHAAMVLTPRSASAHVAAAHKVPAFVWVPDDGENWHLDYPDWPHCRARIAAGVGNAVERLGRFMAQQGLLREAGR